MIKLFNGAWRGLGLKENGLGMIFDFEFREHLKEFKGARLAVFMAICLHSDQNGLSYPSYKLLKHETGYTEETIAGALDDLCSLTINGHRVLARFRCRDENGQFAGSNRYLVFPTEEELQTQFFPNLVQTQENPNVEKTEFGKSRVEVKPEDKDKPYHKKNHNGGSRRAPKKDIPKPSDYVGGLICARCGTHPCSCDTE